MGFFLKTKKEKELIALKEREDREIIRKSDVTKAIVKTLEAMFLKAINEGFIQEFRECNHATLNVNERTVYVSIWHKYRKGDGSDTTLYEIVNFQSQGYRRLNPTMVNELKNVLYEKLSTFEGMEVKDKNLREVLLYPRLKKW